MREARGYVATSVDEVRALVFASAELAAQVGAVKGHDATVGADAETLIRALGPYRDRVLDYLTQAGPDAGPLPAIAVISRLDAMAGELRPRAADTDTAQFAQQLGAATKERAELQATTRLCEAKQQLKDEVGRLKKIAALKAARSAADTNAITQKSSALTPSMRRKSLFIVRRETERLHLRRVTLDDLGGRKGQLTQRPALLGAVRGAADTPRAQRRRTDRTRPGRFLHRGQVRRFEIGDHLRRSSDLLRSRTAGQGRPASGATR